MFDVIVIDPPWPYPGRTPGKSFGYGAVGHYPLMKIEDIIETFEALATIASSDCAIFCWAVHPKLEEFAACAEAMKKHGFRFATCAFTWVKTNKGGTLFKGVGNYTASNTEPCYLLVRGSKPVTRKLVPSVVIHERLKHSQKPEVFQDFIQEMYPLEQNRCLEVFARRPRANWVCVGGELDGCDIRESIQRLGVQR